MNLIKIEPLMDFDRSTPLRCPGEVLLTDYLQPGAMPLARFARRTGIPMTILRQITRGTRRIDAEQALRLSISMEPTPAYWLLLQARYDLAIAGVLLEGPWRGP
jgi:addiction module HigA family antidote